jgi:hypothetical protein
LAVATRRCRARLRLGRDAAPERVRRLLRLAGRQAATGTIPSETRRWPPRLRPRRGTVTTAAFTALAEHYAGRPLTEFFHAWLWDPAFPAVAGS